jgi:hypothetical protein
MDFLTFISSLVQSLAWPAAIALIAFWFRGELRSLFPRLRRIKHKETEIEFIAEVERLKADVEADLPAIPAPAEEDVDVLNRLAEIEPRAAISEAYRRIELAAARAVQRLNIPVDTSLRTPSRYISMLSQKHLDPKRFRQVDELRKLRNEAVHSDDFSLRGEPIKSYIDVARALEEYINSLGA